MSLTILSDADVGGILTNLTSASLLPFISGLTSALQSYSTGHESQYQAHRQSITRPGGPTMLFMPASLPSGSAVKVVGVPPSQPASVPAKRIQGVILLCDADGRATGVLNAAEITAFRTALGSMLLYRRRARTTRIVVFGAGRQALWHLRLALALRGPDVREVTVVNRSPGRARDLVSRLRALDAAAGVAFTVFDVTAGPAYRDRLRGLVELADVVFCTTPSTEPLFPAEWLRAGADRGELKFIAAIGSYTLDMQEIDPVLLREVVGGTGAAKSRAYHPGRGHGRDGNAIVVDSRDACAVEAGELVEAQITGEDIVEVGELIHIQESGGDKEKMDLATWLETGPVVYKSVGIGIMDLAVGKALLETAGSLGVGTRLEEF